MSLANGYFWPEAAPGINRSGEIPKVRFRVAAMNKKQTSLFPPVARSGSSPREKWMRILADFLNICTPAVRGCAIPERKFRKLLTSAFR